MPKFLQDQEKDDASYFGFDTFSDALVATASEPSLRTPFTIAIYGDWGSGKTSLMKTVARKIDSTSKAKALVVWFNAWQYEKANSLFGLHFSLTCWVSLLSPTKEWSM